MVFYEPDKGRIQARQRTKQVLRCAIPVVCLNYMVR